jgi:GNAT superfamily N-acetyltransferase
MPVVRFVPATPADLDAIVAIMRDLYAYDRLEFVEARARRALGGLIADDRVGRAFLIEADEAVVGYVVLTFQYGLEVGGRETFVDELFIKEPHRGRGLGRQTFRFLDGFCRENGILAIHLAVELPNERARRFYESIGFGAPHRYMMSRPVRPA